MADKANLPAAAIFYLLFIAAMVFFVIRRRRKSNPCYMPWSGSLLWGSITYATY